jgi:hypothetical protein
MILASHGLIASSISGVDADWLAYYNRVVTAGGSLTTTEQNATKTLVADLKANGLWTPMKAIYPMVGASAAACAQNLKSSSFTGTFTSGWTFASTGVTPNGTSAYFDTGLAPNGNLTNNNTNISYYSRTNNNLTTNADIGTSAAAAAAYLPINYMYIRSGGGVFTSGNYSYASTVMTGPNSDSKGFYMGNRTSNILTNCWKNGVKQNTNTTTETQNITTVTNNYYLGAINFGGTAAQYASKECALSSIGDGLTDQNALDFYTAVQAFQTTLSRNV